MSGPKTMSVIVALVAASVAHGQTRWYVDDDNCPGPGSGTPEDPFCSIQVGIDAASDGDEVVVSRGEYFENFYLRGKAITLRSTEPTVVGQHIGESRRVRQQVANCDSIFRVLSKLRDQVDHTVSQTQPPPFNEQQDAGCDDRLGNRSDQKDRVLSHGRRCRLEPLTAGQLNAGRPVRSADDQPNVRNQIAAAPIVSQIEGQLPAAGIESLGDL